MRILGDAVRRTATAAAVRVLAGLRGARPPPALPVTAMGLRFPNPLGLAAGFDRTGALVVPLGGAGFGFVEIGTVAAPAAAPADAVFGGLLGVNIGSRRSGLDAPVVEDYAAMLRAAWNGADYVAANLSSPFLRRDGDRAALDRLLRRLKDEQAAGTAATGRWRPLALKVNGGGAGEPMPVVVAAARHYGFEGVVLVTPCVRRLAQVAAFLAPATVISVGGIGTAGDVRTRLEAGAALVQVFTGFVRGGPWFPRRVLAALGAAEAP